MDPSIMSPSQSINKVGSSYPNLKGKFALVFNSTEQLPQSLSSCGIVSCIAFFAVVVFLDILLYPQHTLPKDLPWVGKRRTLFSWIFAHLESLFNIRDMLEEGYRKEIMQYLKQGKPYILPNIFTSDVVIPQNDMKRVLTLPEEDIELYACLKHEIQPWYSLLNPIVTNHFYEVHVPAVRYLDKLMPKQMGQMMNEVADGVTFHLGQDTENWREVCVFDMVQSVAAQIGFFFIAGSPFCMLIPQMDAKWDASAGVSGFYIPHSLTSQNQVVTETWAEPRLSSASVFSLFRPSSDSVPELSGPYPNRAPYNIVAKYLMPLLKERIKTRCNPSTDPTEAEDIMQWHLNRSLTLSNSQEKTPEVISNRLMVFSFASVQTLSVVATHMIFDIYSYPSSKELITELRAEVLAAFESEDRNWTMSGLNKMLQLDSAVRESMRFSSFGPRACLRKVMKKGGITLLDGTWVSQGTTMSMPEWSIHHDESLYSRPHEYVPERYIIKPGQSSARKSIATTSMDYLAFGHGRHACPGRHFSAAQLKLMMAYLLLNYDVEPFVTRPEAGWVAMNYLPSTTATFRVKRRT